MFSCVGLLKDSTYIKLPLLVCERIAAFDILCVAFWNSTPSLSHVKFLLSLFKCEGERVGKTHLHVGLRVPEDYELDLADVPGGSQRNVCLHGSSWCGDWFVGVVVSEVIVSDFMVVWEKGLDYPEDGGSKIFGSVAYKQLYIEFCSASVSDRHDSYRVRVVTVIKSGNCCFLPGPSRVALFPRYHPARADRLKILHKFGMNDWLWVAGWPGASLKG